jgi:hypothetical protein
MEVKESSFKSLLDSTEDYVKTSYELFKLKTIDKASDKASVIISRIAALFVMALFIFMVWIGVGFCFGSILCSIWSGFFIVAGFYGLIGIILYFFTHNALKKAVANSIVKKVFND